MPRPPQSGPRPAAERRRDTEHRLRHDVDLWVASASSDGVPYLVPLSFDWDGRSLLLSTPLTSPTGQNLAATGTVRLALDHTRDPYRFRPTHVRSGLPLVPDRPAPDPGLARGGRAGRP